MRKILSTWGVIILLLVSVVGTAAAQTGVEPTVVPTSQPAGIHTLPAPNRSNSQRVLWARDPANTADHRSNRDRNRDPH